MIKAKFERTPITENPSVKSITPGWFYISYRWIEKANDRRKLHGKWFRISCGSQSCYRALSMSGSIKGTSSAKKGCIYIDWSAWLKLNDYKEKTSNELNLVIKPASWYSIPFIGLSHPDPAYQIATKIALLSITLGILSIVLAVSV